MKKGRRRFVLALALIGMLLLSAACQTPPKKSNKRSGQRNGVDSAQSAAEKNTLDLFASSAELFGSDPRQIRPGLVTDTVFAVVIGSAVLLSGGLVVSAVRAGRASRPRRRSRSV